MGFGSATDRSPDVVAAIRTDLASNATIPIERELLTLARNHLWRHQFRLVPVEANTAFESFALDALKRIDPATTIPDTSDVYAKLRALEKAMGLASVAKARPFTLWFDASIPGWTGLQNGELRSWHDGCYDLRNKVIHRGYSAVQPVEAKTALESTVAAIEFIEFNVVSLRR